MSELRNLIGTAPLTAEIERLARDGSSKQAVGLWLRDLREQNRFLVRDYILRMTGANPQSHYYPRGGGDFLMVVTGIDKSLAEVARIVSALGTPGDVYPELSVVEVRVNNENFIEGPIEKLTNRKDPAFYDLNKRELESIDLATGLQGRQAACRSGTESLPQRHHPQAHRAAGCAVGGFQGGRLQCARGVVRDTRPGGRDRAAEAKELAGPEGGGAAGNDRPDREGEKSRGDSGAGRIVGRRSDPLGIPLRRCGPAGRGDFDPALSAARRARSASPSSACSGGWEVPTACHCWRPPRWRGCGAEGADREIHRLHPQPHRPLDAGFLMNFRADWMKSPCPLRNPEASWRRLSFRAKPG